jgi:hypothetical protein
MPKPPPTSPTRDVDLLLREIGQRAGDVPAATAVGIWLLILTVSRPLAASNDATMLRGSIATGATRWLTMSSAIFTDARANAASVAVASPWRISAATLSGASGASAGAPGAVPATTSLTAGSSSYSTITLSIASRAASRDSATTATTGSPT